MNGKKARKIRKTVYGDSLSSRYRKYRLWRTVKTIHAQDRRYRVECFTVIADEKRQHYKALKKMHRDGLVTV